jgi:hypothetical protein
VPCRQLQGKLQKQNNVETLITLQTKRIIKTTAQGQFRKQHRRRTTISTLHNTERRTDHNYMKSDASKQ